MGAQTRHASIAIAVGFFTIALLQTMRACEHYARLTAAGVYRERTTVLPVLRHCDLNDAIARA